ncbi:MAG: hypothetical protein QOI68_1339 [Pseudonocardiales bacterium]|nr:hypothetical protein [Pseudonocardiales bacterium]
MPLVASGHSENAAGRADWAPRSRACIVQGAPSEAAPRTAEVVAELDWRWSR